MTEEHIDKNTLYEKLKDLPNFNKYESYAKQDDLEYINLNPLKLREHVDVIDLDDNTNINAVNDDSFNRHTSSHLSDLDLNKDSSDEGSDDVINVKEEEHEENHFVLEISDGLSSTYDKSFYSTSYERSTGATFDLTKPTETKSSEHEIIDLDEEINDKVAQPAIPVFDTDINEISEVPSEVPHDYATHEIAITDDKGELHVINVDDDSNSESSNEDNASSMLGSMIKQYNTFSNMN